MKKKVYHLKPNAKKILFIIVVIIIIVGGFIKYKIDDYNTYLYTQTSEYKLMNLGYSSDEIDIIKKSLNDKEIDSILHCGYNEFIYKFVDKKYFILDNLDEYLSQVITKDEDFFKYHGTDGYDYDYIISTVNTHTNHDAYSYDLETDISKDNLMIVNKYYKLSNTYIPSDLVDIDVKYYYGNKKEIKSEVYNAFLQMYDDATNNGYSLVIVNAYIDYDTQAKTYSSYENKKGTKYADSVASRAGYSEHQTGLSLDIFSKFNTSRDTFKDTDTYKWLINNCYKYGFIERYPVGKEKITNNKAEPWHYRYVGVDLAKKIYESGLTYDEYYEYYIK